VHTPAVQAAPPPQTVPQAPQLVVLVFVSTHTPLHCVSPVGQAHAPA
jgi:hypothetical protein